VRSGTLGRAAGGFLVDDNEPRPGAYSLNALSMPVGGVRRFPFSKPCVGLRNEALNKEARQIRQKRRVEKQAMVEEQFEQFFITHVVAVFVVFTLFVHTVARIGVRQLDGRSSARSL
jgi:hypothetical protein